MSSPSPKSPPNASPPDSSPPAPPSPPITSSPPPQSSPPATPSAPPPSTSSSPPPPNTPPPTSSSPPPPPPKSPPPSPPALPPQSPPPPPSAPPPSDNSPPPPPPDSSPPPPDSSPPPPSDPPTAAPPPPESSPPPPKQHKKSPPPPPGLPPAPSTSPTAPPPSSNSPLPSKLPPAPASSPPSIVSPTAPPTNSSTARAPTPPLSPSIPTEKPTANPNITANSTSPATGISTSKAVAMGTIFGFVALSLVIIAIFLVQKRKRKGSYADYNMPSPFASSQKSDSSFLRPNSSVRQASGNDHMYSSPEANGMGNSRSCFTYEELGLATDGFSKKNLLGEGGFGCVYKGNLFDGREVAVKQLKVGGGQGEREFRAEVDIISRVHHRHLVSLVGYCISDHQRLLVYDYLPNNTLDFHLHTKGRPVMEWALRLKAAAGAARGLAYLHEDCHPRIIHRDIKSQNILLDENFEARVADFGLAKLASEEAFVTHVTTRVMGTFGYMAPEYASTGKLTDKSDVYSFGVVLLELITGRKPVDGSQPLGDESLVEWARPLLAQALEDEGFEGLVDPKLENDYVPIELFRMVEAASACVRHSATKRPRMGQIVRAFDSIGDMSSDLTNGVKPGQSGVFDSAQHSAQIRMFQRMAFGSQEYTSSDFSNYSQSSWRK